MSDAQSEYLRTKLSYLSVVGGANQRVFNAHSKSFWAVSLPYYTPEPATIQRAVEVTVNHIFRF